MEGQHPQAGPFKMRLTEIEQDHLSISLAKVAAVVDSSTATMVVLLGAHAHNFMCSLLSSRWDQQNMVSAMRYHPFID